MPTQTIPDQVENPRLADFLEVMTRAVFQAGLSWASIAKQWDAYREAFDAFDPHKNAQYTEADVDRLMQSNGVLHSSRKIRATMHNAQMILDLNRKHGTFLNYLQAFPDYAALSRDIRRHFKFMGEMNVWYFLFRVRMPVPRFEQWVKTIPGEHPRMKEMVEKARSLRTSPEY